MTYPPLLSRLLLRLFAPADRYEDIASEMQELYAGIAESGTERDARRRYRREVRSFCFWRIFGPILRHERPTRIERREVRRAEASRTRQAPRETPYREGASMLEGLIQDIRYGARSLRRRPGFTVIAVLILAIGIGANATIFTFVNGFFLSRPAAVGDPDQMVGFLRIRENGISVSMSYPDFLYYRENSKTLSDLLAYSYGTTAVSVGRGSPPAQADVWLVSANYFEVLEVPMALGAGFPTDRDPVPGNLPLAVLDHGYWQREYGSDPAAVGSDLVMNGSHYTITGVAPAGFRGISPTSAPTDIYVPLVMTPVLIEDSVQSLSRIDGHINYWLRVAGRMQPGVDLATARAEIEVLDARWRTEFAEWISVTEVRPYRIDLTPRFGMNPNTAARIRRLMTVLMLVVGVVLLIACTNIAILQMARASERLREMGIRSALGADRARVIQQLLTEGILLALAGGALGIVLTLWGTRFAASMLPVRVSFPTGPDLPVLLMVLGLSVFAALLFGLAPAWRLARLSLTGAIGHGHRTDQRHTVRNVLVVAQIALSMVLITGAGLFARSLLSALNADLGFERRNRLLVSVSPAGVGYSDQEGHAFVRHMLERVNALVGVEGVTTTAMVPFRGQWRRGLGAPGTAYEEEPYNANFNAVGPDYFELMDIPLIAGRGFEPTDDTAVPLVAIVNEVVAAELWPGQNPIGKTIGDPDGWATVVGLVPAITYYTIGEEPLNQTYMPQLQSPVDRVTFVVSYAPAAGPLAPQIRDLIQEYDPHLAISAIGSLRQVVADQASSYRSMAVLVGLFSAIALLLATVGLYGLQAYLVTRRRHEIGVRMALGARQRIVVGHVLRQGVVLAVIGIAVGIATSVPLASLVRGMLFGIGAHDPLTYLLVPLVLLAAAALASLVPALRAGRVDPIEALRAE
jgi:predicted permease